MSWTLVYDIRRTGDWYVIYHGPGTTLPDSLTHVVFCPSSLLSRRRRWPPHPLVGVSYPTRTGTVSRAWCFIVRQGKQLVKLPTSSRLVFTRFPLRTQQGSPAGGAYARCRRA